MLDTVTRLAPDLLDYHEGWALQRELHAAVVGGAEGALVLCESRAILDYLYRYAETFGLMKIVVDANSNAILGAAILGTGSAH